MNLTVYVPKELEDELQRRARQAGVTPSLFVQSVLRAALAERPASFSPAFRALAGAWEDERSADEVIADIRANRTATKRPALK